MFTSRKTGKSTSADSLIYSLGVSACKDAVGCPSQKGKYFLKGEEHGWSKGGRYDVPAVHNVLLQHRSAVVDAITRRILEEIRIDDERYANIRLGMGYL
jgi:hypothetical protein